MNLHSWNTVGLKRHSRTQPGLPRRPVIYQTEAQFKVVVKVVVKQPDPIICIESLLPVRHFRDIFLRKPYYFV